MMNIGFRPTLAGKKHRLEVHLLTLKKTSMVKVLGVEVLEFIRKEKKI